MACGAAPLSTRAELSLYMRPQGPAQLPEPHVCGGVRDLQLAEEWAGDASRYCHFVIGGFLLDYSPGMQSCICICVPALKRGFCRDTMLLPRANSAEPYSQAVMVTHAVQGWDAFSSLCDTPVNHIKCPDSLGQGDLWHMGLLALLFFQQGAHIALGVALGTVLLSRGISYWDRG